MIIVEASTASDLPAAVRGATISLVPTDATGAPLTFTPGANVGGFTCKPGTTNPMPLKYLPGSCRG